MSKLILPGAKPPTLDEAVEYIFANANPNQMAVLAQCRLAEVVAHRLEFQNPDHGKIVRNLIVMARDGWANTLPLLATFGVRERDRARALAEQRAADGRHLRALVERMLREHEQNGATDRYRELHDALHAYMADMQKPWTAVPTPIPPSEVPENMP